MSVLRLSLVIVAAVSLEQPFCVAIAGVETCLAFSPDQTGQDSSGPRNSAQSADSAKASGSGNSPAERSTEFLGERWELFGGSWVSSPEFVSVEGGSGPRAMILSRNVKDFVVEVAVRIKSPGGQAGIVFRTDKSATGVDAYDGYYAGLHATQNTVLWGRSKHRWTSIARKPTQIKTNIWYQLRVEMRRSNVKIFVNDVRIDGQTYPRIDGVDRTFIEGRIGLRALGGAVDFKGFRVKPAGDSELAETYTNPVHDGCADPAILKYQQMYFLYCTHSPDHPNMPRGIRLHVSRDLVHWEDRGFVLRKKDSWGQSRFWAPDIVHRDGVFYLYYSADTRMCVATSESPFGPFRQTVKQPMLPNSLRIDGHVFRDEDGRYYFYYVQFHSGNEIWGGRLNDDMLTVDQKSLRRMVKADRPWEQHRGRIVEGPVVFRHKGFYYLTYSGSHFESPEYAVGYATSKSPLGPWQKYEHNPIMKSTGFANGTAHHCLTASPDGTERFIVYHRHANRNATEPRCLAIDRIRLAPQTAGPDVLEIWGPTSSSQPIPSR